MGKTQAYRPNFLSRFFDSVADGFGNVYDAMYEVELAKLRRDPEYRAGAKRRMQLQHDYYDAMMKQLKDPATRAEYIRMTGGPPNLQKPSDNLDDYL